MPYADLSMARLYYVLDGPRDAPVLMLSNSLGSNADMWAPQVSQLARHFRVLRYDTRGHGLSSVPSGDYSFEQLAGDVAELLDHLKIEAVHFCGLSMGGPTGMQFALDNPHRVNRLVLSNTAARIGSVDSWNQRIAAVKQETLHAMAPMLVDRWLTAPWLAAHPTLAQALVDMMRRLSDTGYARNCAALRDGDLRQLVGRITAPTLVIGGTHDVSTTPQQGRELAAAIPGARYEELDAGHISNWEQPQAFAQLLLDFLKE